MFFNTFDYCVRVILVGQCYDMLQCLAICQPGVRFWAGRARP
jgi:hypothetical protein